MQLFADHKPHQHTNYSHWWQYQQELHQTPLLYQLALANLWGCCLPGKQALQWHISVYFVHQRYCISQTSMIWTVEMHFSNILYTIMTNIRIFPHKMTTAVLREFSRYIYLYLRLIILNNLSPSMVQNSYSRQLTYFPRLPYANLEFVFTFAVSPFSISGATRSQACGTSPSPTVNEIALCLSTTLPLSR